MMQSNYLMLSKLMILKNSFQVGIIQCESFVENLDIVVITYPMSSLQVTYNVTPETPEEKTVLMGSTLLVDVNLTGGCYNETSI